MQEDYAISDRQRYNFGVVIASKPFRNAIRDRSVDGAQAPAYRDTMRSEVGPNVSARRTNGYGRAGRPASTVDGGATNKVYCG